MAVDTPANVAIVGAGPIGLEAALYARYLGYDVSVFERGCVAENVRRWGHVQMFSPFGLNRSPLGLAALAAQDEQYQPPDDDALLNARQYMEQYLVPLSKTDLLAGHVHEGTRVIAVGRDATLKGEMPGGQMRAERPFRLLLRSREGQERFETADIVVDSSGVFTNPNWAGVGGMPAVGEPAVRQRIEYRLPDLEGADRPRYENRHTLVIGNGYSAATNVAVLARLAREAPATASPGSRRPLPTGAAGPLSLIEGDRLPQRDQLAREANRCASGQVAHVEHWPTTDLLSLAWEAGDEDDGGEGEEGRFVVELSGPHAGRHHFDRVLANVGFRPDGTIYEELQVHECYASQGPMKLAAALLGQTSADCLDQTAGGASTLGNPEPNFYILGSKSYGRNSKFLLGVGLQQIRDLFAMIGDRADLDLYSSVKSQST